MTAPFCDATRAEVVARVAFQLVKLEYRRSKATYERAGLLIATVQASDFVRQSLDFRLALSSMYLECGTEGRTSKQWLTGAITRSRSGLLFRAVFHPAYKATRRDPRVTNRGVGNDFTRRPASDETQWRDARSNPDD